MDRKVRRYQGNTARKRWRLLQAGVPIPLDGASEVRMLVGLAAGQDAEGTTEIDGVCAVDDAVLGIVREPVGGLGELELALYDPVFRITFGDGSTETVAGPQVEVVPEPGG